jgi:hypothetical protein
MKGPTALLLVALFAGCTHTQLRFNTLHQAQVVHEIHEQQVLDNLAMFVGDPNAVPFFTVVGAGTAAVSDTANASVPLGWIKAGFQSVGLTISGIRLSQENFTLAPISDPDRLARMRCAYRAAIGYPLELGGCVDCCALAREWSTQGWTGKPAPKDDPQSQCPDACWPHPGFFCSGSYWQVPKHALYVGHYRHNYVWVTSNGTDEFARLVLAILDFATAVPPKPPSHGGPPTELLPPLQQGAPMRQNFFAPTQPPQVVIPIAPLQ